MHQQYNYSLSGRIDVVLRNKLGWYRFYTDTFVHVVPRLDLTAHLLDVKCLCKPTLLYSAAVITHNSHDKREYFEETPKKMEVVN